MIFDDEVRKWLAASSATTDPRLKKLYAAEARIWLEEAERAVKRADTMVRALEREILRVEGLEK
jgi:hypothetical protein